MVKMARPTFFRTVSQSEKMSVCSLMQVQ